MQCNSGCKHQIKIVGGIQEKKPYKAVCLATQYRIQGCVYLELARIQYNSLKQCSSGVTLKSISIIYDETHATENIFSVDINILFVDI